MLEVVSIHDNENHVTGEYFVKPVHVFVTTTCQNIRIDELRIPEKRVKFKFKKNIIRPKTNETSQQLKNEIDIAVKGLYALKMRNEKGIVMLCRDATGV